MPAKTERLQAYWNSIFSVGCRSSISPPLKFELTSNTNAQLIQTLITIYHKKQKWTRKKKEEKEKKGRTIDHMTERKRRQNPPGVAAFLRKAEWINETAPTWTPENSFLKKSSNYWL